MYHEQGIRQPEIAAALDLSLPRVSRLLKEAVTRGLVRTVVTLPALVFASVNSDCAGLRPTCKLTPARRRPQQWFRRLIVGSACRAGWQIRGW
ncbi:hypothetical protein ACBJ59_54385 [Nonomuraea sp. MTCD27]|uniref:hypothetical protein n=1 Tax=Nonomuraea sp. MTCD27 TaxID=1676747 RepID=UPI0035BF0612